MKAQAQHTPTEWTFDMLHGKAYIYGDSNSDNKHCIAVLDVDPFGRTKADAEYLTRSANAHLTLVRALQEVAMWLISPDLSSITIAEVRERVSSALESVA